MRALSQPIGGLLNDTFGPMLVAAVGLGVAALGALSLGMAQSVIGLAAGRMLTGIGLTSILSGTVAFQAAAFPPDRYAFFSGVTYFMGNLGAVVSVARSSAREMGPKQRVRRAGRAHSRAGRGADGAARARSCGGAAPN